MRKMDRLKEHCHHTDHVLLAYAPRWDSLLHHTLLRNLSPCFVKERLQRLYRVIHGCCSCQRHRGSRVLLLVYSCCCNPCKECCCCCSRLAVKRLRRLLLHSNRCLTCFDLCSRRVWLEFGFWDVAMSPKPKLIPFDRFVMGRCSSRWSVPQPCSTKCPNVGCPFSCTMMTDLFEFAPSLKENEFEERALKCVYRESNEKRAEGKSAEILIRFWSCFLGRLKGVW